ncbi:hypothetical protein GCM10027048_09660 [Hymenobacter coalescens]
MLSFANPAALLALLGLLVPLAIHLWNRRPGHVVPVGALRWLTPGAARRTSRLHLTQWPLLLLRLLLLTLLVGLLAAPRWSRLPLPMRPQVLVSPAVLASAAWPVLRPTVDSLRRRGAELRAFSPGFPLLADSVAIRNVARTAQASAGAADWYWPRAAEAADSFPGQPLYLFTAASLTHFNGTRPLLPARLRWQLVPLDSAARPWLQAASRPHPDSLHVLVGRGDGTGSRFRRYRLAWPGRSLQPLAVPGLPALQLRQRGPDFALQSTGPDSIHVPVEPALRVGISYDESRREDLRYVRAALQAAAPALPAGLRLRVLPVADAARLTPDSLHWLLWLSDAALPSELQRQVPAGLRVLRDAPSPGEVTASTFAPGDMNGPVSRLLRRSHPAPAPGSVVLWSAADGQPVLTQQRRASGAEYQLHTRMHPQWSSLPDDGQLPALLLDLLAPAPAVTVDPRVIGSDQLLARPAGTERAAPRRAAYLNLQPWVALAAGLLFGLERLLAARHSSATAV